jgi:GlpG protein
LRLPLAVDLSGFVKLLQRMQVPHRVSEEAGEQVLWVPAKSAKTCVVVRTLPGR